MPLSMIKFAVLKRKRALADVGSLRKVQSTVINSKSPNIYMITECDNLGVSQGTSVS